MVTLHITAEELNDLINKVSQNGLPISEISKIWKSLGDKGDAYAFMAAYVVSDDTAS